MIHSFSIELFSSTAEVYIVLFISLNKKLFLLIIGADLVVSVSVLKVVSSLLSEVTSNESSGVACYVKKLGLKPFLLFI